MNQALRSLFPVLMLPAAVLAQNAQFGPDTNRNAWQLAPSDSPYRQLLLADLDGDGDGDAVTRTVNEVRVQLQGTLTTWTDMLLPVAAGSVGLTLVDGDFDGNGTVDVLAVALNPQTPFGAATVGVHLLPNNGTGTFAPGAPQALPFNFTPDRIAAGDVDGDGDLDVVIGATAPTVGPQPTTFLQLLRNNGSGAMQLVAGAFPIVPAGGRPTLADFDADGDLDVLVARPNGPTLFFRNQGGAFTADPTFPPPGTAQMLELAAFDADGDGDVDVLALAGNGTVALWRNVGATLVAVPVAAAGVVEGIATGDVDGDGDVDAVIRTSTSTTALQNDGTGTFTPMAPIAGNGTLTALVVGRVDNDGFADALVGQQHGGLSGLAYMGSPAGLQTDPMVGRIALPPLGGHAVPLMGEDLNGDGRQDQLVLVDQLNGAQWVRAFVAGRFGAVAETRSASVLRVPKVATAVDVDGDADLDILMHDHLDQVVWLRNNGGQFVTGNFLNGIGVSAAAFGDLDGDGDVDVLVVEQFGSVRVLRNDGTGSFDNGTVLPESAWLYSRAALVADLDGDGDLDAITGRGTAGCLDVLRNTGNGGFVLQPGCAYPTTSMPNGLRSGDLDGDGDLDVVQWNAANVRLMFNGGALSFSDQTAVRLVTLPAANVQDVVVFDADGDVDLDLLLLASSGQQLYVNDGTGVFTDATGQRWTQLPPSAFGASTDLDGDGDLDLVVDEQFVWNRLRQLSSLQTPRLGGALTLRMHLEPGFLAAGFGLVAIAFQPLANSVVMPGLGRIEIVADGHLPLATIPAPVGACTQSLAIPPAVVLFGTDLHCQALFLSSQTGVTVSNALHERIR